MGIFNRIRRHYETPEEKEVAELFEQAEDYQNRINALVYSICVVVNFIARKFALCDVNFYKNGKREYKEDYFIWNVKPNKFQTAFELKYDFASQLLLNEEALILEKNDSIFVADYGFSKDKKGINEYIFSNVSKDNETFIDYMKGSDVIYASYEGNGIRQKLEGLLRGLQDIMTTAASNYELTAYQKGFLNINAPEKGSKELKEKIDDLLNNRFKKLFRVKGNAVIPLYDGMSFIDINNDRSSTKKSEVSDINTLISEMIKETAIAYGVMPSAILGDKENTTEAEKATLGGAIKPIAKMLEQAINGSGIIGKNDFVKDRYAEVDLTPLTYTTIFDHAEASDKLLASSQYSTNELRMARGNRPIDAWWADRYFGTKNYELLPVKENADYKGGE